MTANPNGEVLLTWSRQAKAGDPISAMAATLDPNTGELGERHEWGPGNAESAAPLGDGYLAVRQHVDPNTNWIVERLDAVGQRTGTALPLGFILSAVVHGTPDGGAVVVASGVTGTGGALQAWRFGPDGALLGGPVQLAESSSLTATGVDAGGNLVVVWTDSGRRLSARRFSPDLEPLGPVITVALGGVSGIGIAVAPDGRFVIIYTKTSLWVRSFHADGSPAGVRRLNLPRFGFADSGDLDVAIGPDGRILVVWKVYEYDSNIVTLRARFLSPAGRPLGGLFRLVQIPLGGRGNLMRPRTESIPEGGFLVLWTHANAAGDRFTLRGLRLR